MKIFMSKQGSLVHCIARLGHTSTNVTNGAEREGDPEPDEALTAFTCTQQRANNDQENTGQPDPNDDLNCSGVFYIL